MQKVHMSYPIVRHYTEGDVKIPNVFLPDRAYGEALQCFVPVCTDIVPVDPKNRLIYLASRKSRPMTGLWWIGGRMRPGEVLEDAAVRNFKRETQVELTKDRLQLVGIFSYIWKDRSQEPCTMGCHMCGFTYIVELHSNELFAASRSLEKDEYETGFGLRAYSREHLIQENVYPTILDLYDTVFPQTASSPMIVDSI